MVSKFRNEWCFGEKVDVIQPSSLFIVIVVEVIINNLDMKLDEILVLFIFLDFLLEVCLHFDDSVHSQGNRPL